jgi:hypothetical protein
VALVETPQLRQTAPIPRHPESCVWLAVAVAEKKASSAQQICLAGAVVVLLE